MILEHDQPTTPKGIHQVLRRIQSSRIALETGTNSPWVSRQLSQITHEGVRTEGWRKRRMGSKQDDSTETTKRAWLRWAFSWKDLA